MAIGRALMIGELSRRTGVHVETVRYYEKAGLLPPPPRSAGGHRQYGENELKRLIFIRRCRDLGLSLDEIRNLLGLVEGGGTCGAVRDAALSHLMVIRRKIADLQRMDRTLAGTVARCAGGTAPKCPIVEALSDRSSPARSSRSSLT